jgi:hypothetical protein
MHAFERTNTFTCARNMEMRMFYCNGPKKMEGEVLFSVITHAHTAWLQKYYFQTFGFFRSHPHNRKISSRALVLVR